MATVDTFTATAGTTAWSEIDLAWTGTATTWTLYQSGIATALYTGANLSYTFTAVPGTRYSFRLVASDTGDDDTATLVYVTQQLPAPSNLYASGIGTTSATLYWTQVTDATGYDIADVADAYSIENSVGTVGGDPLSGLTADTSYSRAVRSKLGTVVSRWSNPITFTTAKPTGVSAGSYTYEPTAVGIWQAGLPGSSSPQWKASNATLYHGSGEAWGDTSGALSTVFFYGDTNPFSSLSTNTPTKLEVWIAREYDGSSAAVTSRWHTHTYGSQPGGEPTLSAGSSDVGSLAHGESAWVELPIGWASDLIGFTNAKGIAWGNVAQRYQSADNDLGVNTPANGTLRFTVT